MPISSSQKRPLRPGERPTAKAVSRTRRGLHRALRRDYVLVGVAGAIAAALGLIALTAHAYLATVQPSPAALLVSAFLASLAAVAITVVAYRRHRATLEMALGHRAERGILRVERVIERADSEDRLLKDALAAMAGETGIDSWALYLRRPPDQAFALAGSLAAPENAPDTLTLAEATSLAEHLDATDRTGSAALTEQGEIYGLVRCWSRAEDPMGAEERAHVRWMAGALSAGIRRLRETRALEAKATMAGALREIALVVDAGGRIEDASEQAIQTLGGERHRLVGARLRDLARCSDGTAVERLLALDDGDEDPKLHVLWLEIGDDRLAIEVRITPLDASRPDESPVLLLGRDVTERLACEEERDRREQELERENARLLSELDRSEEAQRNQLYFIVNASHELRTPLNAVIGFATLIEQDVADEEGERSGFARSIRESAEQLLEVLNDILDLAKMESGRFQLTLEEGDLTPVLQSAVDAVSPLAQRKGLNVRLDLPIDPLVLRLDAARMRQVLVNLIGNAVKFTDVGEIRIKAGLEAGCIAVRIEDTGVGISPENQSGLFQRFTQADAPHGRRRGGTGLGLAISRGLVEGMEGRIEIQSEGIGCGTQVRLEFPAVGTAAGLEPTNDRGVTWRSES